MEQTQAKKGKGFSNPQWLQGFPRLIPQQVFPKKEKKIASIFMLWEVLAFMNTGTLCLVLPLNL